MERELKALGDGLESELKELRATLTKDLDQLFDEVRDLRRQVSK